MQSPGIRFAKGVIDWPRPGIHAGADRLRPATSCERIPMSHTRRPLSVLVVDDEALLRWSIAELLRRRGHAVSEASSAREAGDAITRGSAFDLVLLDLRLPDASDLTLLDEVCRRLPQSVVVLMSAHATDEVIQDALGRGAARVFGKPFDMRESRPVRRRLGPARPAAVASGRVGRLQPGAAQMDPTDVVRPTIPGR